MSKKDGEVKSEEKTLTDIKKIVIDFTRDILVTFPEQKVNLHPDLQTLLASGAATSETASSETASSGAESETDTNALLAVYAHCKKVYPERFFDILYQNNDVFNSPIEFLPGIDFSLLWADKDLSEKTRETIWKYLQLLLFTLVSSISDGSSFGDTAKLFEAIDENEFKAKLEETIAQMQNVFAKNGGEGGEGEGTEEGEEGTEGTGGEGMPNINLNDLPDPKDIHEHVTGMMNGKLGKLAREIAEETAAELNMDMENAGSVNDVFQTLFKNPTKLMSLVKNVGSKLDTKLKSGDMKESELLQEASDIMQKMKSMPGMGDLQAMLAKMGMGHMMPGGGGAGGGGKKVNVNAMQANLDRNLKAAKNKERLLATLEKRKQAQAQAQQSQSQGQSASLQSVGLDAQGRESLVFSKGEQVERSVRPSASGAGGASAGGAGGAGGAVSAVLESASTSANKKKKNKNKNKKVEATAE